MKLKKYLFFIFLIPGTLIAKTNAVDSLIDLLKKAKTDTTRVAIYSTLTEQCDEQDITAYCDSAMIYYERLGADQQQLKTMLSRIG